jgi:hypothetical protein
MVTAEEARQLHEMEQTAATASKPEPATTAGT